MLRWAGHVAWVQEVLGLTGLQHSGSYTKNIKHQQMHKEFFRQL
jgi:hypothetical protein